MSRIFESDVSVDFPAIARGVGLAQRGDAKAFVSKVMVFDKEAIAFTATVIA